MTPKDTIADEAEAQTKSTLQDRTADQDLDWCDRALRLQAEMENYRKRQQRLAQDQIESERQRLLRTFLQVVDDLERALEAPAGDGESVRQGIRLTHRTALHLLEKEGVERITPENEPFDPTWHEAVSTTQGDHTNASPDTVVQVLEPGYRLDDRLLRPAKVIVAV
jgi:molecular chaperone GrpE